MKPFTYLNDSHQNFIEQKTVRVALAAGPKSRTQRQDRSWSDGEQVYLVQPGVKQEVGWSGAYQAGGSEDCRRRSKNYW